MPLSQSQMSLLAQRFKADERVVAVYLLGSALTEAFRPESDIDLALLLRPGLHFGQVEALGLAAEFGCDLAHPLDIGLLTTQNLIYAREAITKGKRIFCRDAVAADLFAASALALYTELKQERREIEDAYCA
jgi:predicted nucleotidyltransferase